MPDLYEELKKIVARLNGARIEYALCGGLAMAVYGFARATIHIEVMIQPEDLDTMGAIASDLGYTIEAKPMKFADGKVMIHRFSKSDPDSEDILSLDVILLTPQLQLQWTERQWHDWEEGRLCVMSPDGMIELKSLRGSPRDQEDIEKLRELP